MAISLVLPPRLGAFRALASEVIVSTAIRISFLTLTEPVHHPLLVQCIIFEVEAEVVRAASRPIQVFGSYDVFETRRECFGAKRTFLSVPNVVLPCPETKERVQMR